MTIPRINTATITFHGSHNYGSMLQAYALQKVIHSLGYNNEIINLRTNVQKDLYTVFTKRKGLKYIFKNFSHLLYYFPLKRKYEKFEVFLHRYLIVTKEYSCKKDLEDEQFDYKYYIAGSDQIWNPEPADFDWSYYLTFVKAGKRIAYAPSFGQLSSFGNNLTMSKIKKSLMKFDTISVREKGSADNVERMIGRRPNIVLDPTLLIGKDTWLTLIKNEKRIIKSDYIFFYTLFADKDRLDIVKKISKHLNLPIVTSNFSNQYDVINPFIKMYDAGPLDFLALIRDAKFVITSSFHGTVFASILNVPFFAINGLADARISTLLSILNLESRAVTINSVDEKYNDAYNINFDEVNNKITMYITPSINFLKESLSK